MAANDLGELVCVIGLRIAKLAVRPVISLGVDVAICQCYKQNKV